MTQQRGDTVGSRFRSLRDMVCSEIRDQIIESELAPGERLVERELAEQLDVSRIVVREAIQVLAAEGLVTVTPRRGAIVSLLDVEGAEELFEVRISLESLAAGAAAERRTDEDLARFDALLVEAQQATEAGDARRAAHVNMEFHQAVVEAGGNRLLASISGSLSGPSLRLFRIGQDSDTRVLHQEHLDLVEAIRAGDRRRATRLMADHIAATRKSAVATLRTPRKG